MNKKYNHWYKDQNGTRLAARTRQEALAEMDRTQPGWREDNTTTLGECTEPTAAPIITYIKDQGEWEDHGE